MFLLKNLVAWRAPRRAGAALAAAVLVVSALALGGCASTRVIDQEVRAYSTLAAMPQPASYRIERLPSQQQDTPYRRMIERQATEALARVGLQRDDAHGALRLELGAHSQRYLPDWPHYGPGLPDPWGWWPGPLWGGYGYYGSWRERPPTLYLREVRLLLRDAQGRVVYESSARYDDIWRDDEAIFRSLFDAALDGFPTPPEGPRRIRRELAP